MTNEPRMHRCSLTAMAPVISFFLARVRSTFSFPHASMKTQNVAQSVHRAWLHAVAEEQREKEREGERKIANAQRDLYFANEFVIIFFSSLLSSFFVFFLSLRSSIPVSLPQLVPHYTSNRIPPVVVVLINTVRAIRLAYGGRISTIFIGRREFRRTREFIPLHRVITTLLPNIRCPATSPLSVRFVDPSYRRVSRIIPNRALAFATCNTHKNRTLALLVSVLRWRLCTRACLRSTRERVRWYERSACTHETRLPSDRVITRRLVLAGA